jgi:hypothetical protein
MGNSLILPRNRARMPKDNPSHLGIFWMKSLAQRTSPIGLDEVDLETRKNRQRMSEDPSTIESAKLN